MVGLSCHPWSLKWKLLKNRDCILRATQRHLCLCSFSQGTVITHALLPNPYLLCTMLSPLRRIRQEWQENSYKKDWLKLKRTILWGRFVQGTPWLSRWHGTGGRGSRICRNDVVSILLHTRFYLLQVERRVSSMISELSWEFCKLRRRKKKKEPVNTILIYLFNFLL